MKKDSLKKLVSDHRAAFERRVPDPRVWEAVREQLPKPAAKTNRRTNAARIWWAAASVLLLLGLGGYFMTGDQSAVETLTHDAPPIDVQEPKTMQDTIQRSAPVMATVEADEKHEVEAETLLENPSSVSSRLAGILELAVLPELSQEQMEGLLEVINTDPSTNVRMAALNTVAERTPETHQSALIQEVFVHQDDPSLQLELMLAMSRADSLQLNAATADRLYAITTDPLSLDFIKEHAYAVLMRSW